jgi:hypothetical protein
MFNGGLMKIEKIRFLFLTVVIGLTAPNSPGQQVIETSTGKVEFIGLEKWTPKIIQEKLGYSSPDQLHYCVVELKKIGFPESSVVVYRQQDGKKYTVITVVEPESAGQVRYRLKPSGSLSIPDEWKELVQLVEEKKHINGLLDYGSTLGQRSKINDPENSVEPLWKLLKQRRSIKDYRIALKRLADDGDYRNRVVAAMILTNFATRDAAWRALMEGVRDPDFWVSADSTQALITLTKYVPRRVNWSPVASGISYILSGTNLYALPHVLETLSKTNVSRKLAKPLFGGGGRMVVAYLKASHERERSLAHQLLVQLSGRDLGFDNSRWASWISSLN